MVSMKSKYVLLLAVCFLTFLVRCTTAPLAGGSDNPDFVVVGSVKDTNGSPARNAIVSIIPESYNPVSDEPLSLFMTDTTDILGNYRLVVLQKGVYNLQGIDPQKGTRLLVNGISVAEDTSLVNSVTMATPGAVKIALPSTGINRESGYIYVPGTSIAVFLDSQKDSVIIDSIPAGNLQVLAYAEIAGSDSFAIRFNVPVESGKTTEVVNSLWRYSCRIFLNTTAEGADVAGDVALFPVLIRLNEDNFDFSKVQPDGADIRFTKSDNSALSYEIECWDAGDKRAQIWVKVDTVYGNNSTQHIVMYWGNPDVVGRSDAGTVFDTANSFVGVWHMNEEPLTGKAAIKDRTVNGHNATSLGTMTSANSCDGIIGKALSFDGVDDYLDAGNVSVTGNYTIGLWVLLDTLEKSQRFIFKDSCYTLWYDNDTASVRVEHMSTTTWWRGYPQDSGTQVPMVKGKWNYLTGTFDGSFLRLYRNGTELSVTEKIAVLPRTSSDPLWIGKAWNIDFVDGTMDEVRIEGTARQADWIRLCYMNQRIDDLLINFE